MTGFSIGGAIIGVGSFGARYVGVPTSTILIVSATIATVAIAVGKGVSEGFTRTFAERELSGSSL